MSIDKRNFACPMFQIIQLLATYMKYLALIVYERIRFIGNQIEVWFVLA